MKLKTTLIPALSLLAAVANADEIHTVDGSSLFGQIVKIDQGVVTIETDFAGQISIPQEKIASFSTDDPIYLTVEQGSTYFGPVEGDPSGLTIRSEDGTLSTRVASISEVWQQGERAPSVVRADRNWEYVAAFDLTGKSGNRESQGLAANFNATLNGPNDRLEFYANANFEETDDTKAADDAHAGVVYTNKFGDHFNWYARSEIGRDVIKDIELYVTTAAGFGYSFVDTEKRYLNLRAGIGYIFESYDDVLVVDPSGVPVVDGDGNLVFEPRPEESSASLDLGINHRAEYNYGTWRNRVTYTPAFDDFGNYRLVHDTSLEMPLQRDGWSIRAGVNNRYDSQAALSDKEELDTTYYVRMVLRWL